ncbi:MAG: alpha/beta hydrolase [Clostridia bacterium]|nr:alpha/beta hydrolase [Clostridia bacterium]
MFATEKVVYKRAGETDVTALIYLPEKKAEKTPVCFWIHGGGWILGDGTEPEHCPELTRGLLDAGVAIVSCEYRLANGEDVMWRELIGDCSDFLRYFTRNAEKFGLDLDRAFLAGISAGGHLILTMAYGAENFGTDDGTLFPEFKCILDMCGPVDMRRVPMAKEKGALKTFLRKFLHGDEAYWEEIYPLVSPIDFAKKADKKRLVPVMAVQGMADELVEPTQPLILKKLYDEVGAEFELLLVENGSHGFNDVKGLPPASPKKDVIQARQLEFALRHIAK